MRCLRRDSRAAASNCRCNAANTLWAAHRIFSTGGAAAKAALPENKKGHPIRVALEGDASFSAASSALSERPAAKSETREDSAQQQQS